MIDDDDDDDGVGDGDGGSGGDGGRGDVTGCLPSLRHTLFEIRISIYEMTL